MGGRRKYTKEEFIEKARAVHGDKYDYSKVVYVHSDKKVKIICPIHGEFKQTPKSHLYGRGCPECKKVKLSNEKILTHEGQVEAINKVNPDVEVLGEITRDAIKVLCRCKVCRHQWMVTPNHLKQGRGCPECAKVKTGHALRLTHEEHVADIAKANPNVEVLGEIINARTKVLTRCKICGHEWNVAPYSLKAGYGCPVCSKIKRANARKLTHNEQAAAIAKINPGVEILGEIKGNGVKVLCRCKVCSHEWEVTPDKLKQGRGCPACSGHMRLTHKEQIETIAKVNPNVEVLGEITNDKVKVLCLCKTCGHKWGAKPYSLKAGAGCPRCAKYGFHSHDVGKLYIMVDDLNVPTMMKIGVSVREDRSKQVLRSAHKAGVTIPALYVAKTWEGPTELMMRIEQMMHENYAEWNIKFPAKFDGCTEFFYYTPETAEAFDIIEETYRELINANQAA